MSMVSRSIPTLPDHTSANPQCQISLPAACMDMAGWVKLNPQVCGGPTLRRSPRPRTCAVCHRLEPRGTARALRCRAREEELHGDTVYRMETRRLARMLLLRQSLKNLLQFLQETNGEMHMRLHNYIADHPVVMSDGSATADQWIAELAAQPLTRLKNPGRASFVSAAAMEAALGEREVSPREVAERLMLVMQRTSEEMSSDILSFYKESKAQVMREALMRTVKLDDDDEGDEQEETGSQE